MRGRSEALRTVAREAAEQTVAQLSGKPCPADCQDVRDLKATVYGNGSDGLKTTVTRYDEQLGDLVWYKRAVILESIGLIGALLLAAPR